MKTSIEDLIVKRGDSIESRASIQDVVKKMSKNHVKHMVLIENDKVMGIITLRDILYLYHEEVDFETAALDIATLSVVTMSYKRPLGYAINLMIDHGIRRVVIVDENEKYFGSVVQEELIYAYEQEFFKSHTKVSELVDNNNRIISVNSDAKLSDALDKMTENGIGSILIYDDSSPIGIITESDILTLAQEHISTDKNVKEFMHSPVLEIEWNAHINDVIEFMKKNQLRHLLTHNPQNEYYIISSKDILKNIKGNYNTFLEAKLKDVRDTFEQINEVLIELTDLGDDQVVSWLNSTAKNLLNVKLDVSIKKLIPANKWKSIYKELKKNNKLSSQTISIGKKDFNFNVSMSDVLGTNIIKILMTDITELTTLNKKLSTKVDNISRVATNQEKLFKETFDQAAVGILHVSKENKVLNSNAHILKLLGYTKEEIIGKDIYSITHQDYIEITKDSYKKLYVDKTIDSFSIDKRCIKKDGSTIWINVTTSPSLDEDPEKQYSICVLVDISDRKSYEQELAEATSKYEKILQLTPEVITVSRLSDGAVIEINDQGLKQAGYTREEWIGNVETDENIWLDKKDRKKFLDTLRLKGNISKYVHEFRIKDGDIRLAEVNASALEIDNEDCFVAIFRDITEQQQLLDDLTKSNELFEGIYNQAAVGIAINNVQGGFIQANQKFCNIFDYTEDELKAMTVFDLTHKDYIDISGANLKKIGSNKINTFSIEKRYIRKDGSLFWGHVTVSDVKDSHGETKFTIAVLEDIQSKKEAQQHTEELAHLMDLNVNEVYIMDKSSFRINYANKTAIETTGYSLKKLQSMTPADLVRKSEDELAELFRRLVDHETDRIPFIQTEHIRADGTLYPIQAHLQLVEYNSQEQILAVIVNSTEEMKAQKDAAFQYKLLRSVLDSTDDLIFYKDYLHTNGDYIGVNLAMARFLNRPENTIVGFNDFDIFSKDVAQEFQKADKKVLKNKKSEYVEEWVSDVYGNSFLFNTLKTPFYNESNELVGILGIGRNITEAHEQKIKIIEQKEQLENAQRIAHIGSWDLDIKSGKLNWSDEVYKIFEIDKNRYKPSYELLLERIYPDDVEKVDKAYSDSVEHKILYDITHRIIIDENTIKHVHERAEHKYDENGVIIASIGTVQDITQVVKYEEELKRQEEFMMVQSRHAAMGEMIGMIAHQWRQPLSIISMSANNMLLDISLDDINIDEFENVARSILNQIHHLSKTIDDFRNFFRPDNDKETVMLRSVIEESIDIFGASLRNDNIELILDIQSDTLINIFSRELLQVYINLIKNAKDALLEHKKDDRKIKITLTEDTDNINTIFCDNGGGVPTDVIDKIFDPYFTTKDAKVGTGIGLHMSKTIIEKHMDGTLTVENDNDGACFTVQLPKTKKVDTDELNTLKM